MNLLKGQEEQKAIRWMEEAALTAKSAKCSNAKCGAVIIKGERLIGRGYNAPPLDREENRTCDRKRGFGKPNYDQTCCMHAEWRAILDALKQHPNQLSGSKLYFIRVGQTGAIIKSSEPYCTVCSRMALDVGVTKFLLWHEKGICEYPTDEYNKLSYSYVYKN